MKKFYFFTLIPFLFLEAYSQDNVTSFGTENTGQSKVLIPNKDGALIFGEQSKADKKELLIYQTDKQNALIWAKSISAKDPLVITDVVRSNSGGYVLAAENYINNRESLLLIDLNQNGEENWVSTFNEEGNEVEPYAIAATPSAYYIGGFTKLATLSVNSYYNFSIEKQYPYLLKSSLDGKKVWSKQIQLDNKNVVGDIRDIAIVNNDIVFIANVYNPESKTKSLTNYLIKIDEKGNVIWSKSIQDKGIELLKIKIDESNNIYLAGKKTISDKNTDVSLMKLTSEGKITWSKTIGNQGFEIPIDLTSHNKEIYLSISTTSFDKNNRSQSLILKINHNGNIISNSAIKNMDFSKIASLKYFENKLYFSGSFIKITNHIEMKSISGTIDNLQSNNNLKLTTNNDNIDFVNSSINFVSIKMEVNPSLIQNDYKITIANEKINSKKL